MDRAKPGSGALRPRKRWPSAHDIPLTSILSHPGEEGPWYGSKLALRYQLKLAHCRAARTGGSAAALALVALLGAAACRPGADTARGVAERFLDEHYVVMNLEAAKRYCTGLALHKVEEELALIGDQVVDESTQRPRVSYDLAEERPEGEDRNTLIYNGSVRLEGGDTFTLRWLVTTRREADGWRVSNFKEMQ